MGLSHQPARSLQSWRLLLALLCVLLVVVGGTVQVAHTHADGSANHADCSLCVVAHASIHVAAIPVATPIATVSAPVEQLPLALLPRVVPIFALFTRPPPASVLPA